MLLLVAGVIAALVWSLYPALRLEYQASSRMAVLEQQRAQLQARNATLRSQVAALKTPAGIEQAAREGLGYTKQGENAYVVVSSTSTPSASRSGAPTAASANASSFVRTVLDAIFGVPNSSTSVEP